MVIVHLLFYPAVGWVIGCFTPAVCRKVKAMFVAEVKTAAADVAKKL